MKGLVLGTRRLTITARWLVPVMVSSVLVVVVSAAAAAAIETRTVDSFPRGLWWATSLITTVGFIGEPPETAAGAMHFELAAVYRDQLHAIDKVREEQRVVAADDIDRDVLGIYREGDIVELAILHVRRGKLADVATFSIRNAEVPDEEVVSAFLAQHYAAAEDTAASLPIPAETAPPTLF